MTKRKCQACHIFGQVMRRQKPKSLTALWKTQGQEFPAGRQMTFLSRNSKSKGSLKKNI